ncbi:integrase core domain containing protein [Acanthamoeba castellanii str. Neff]
MLSEVAKWVVSCKACQQQKAPQQGKNGPLQSILVVTRPFERVGMDLMGPFQESDSGNKWILIMIDYLTKWPVVVALPDKRAETVARAFVEQLVCNHGAPECLLSDQGHKFLNKVLASVNANLHTDGLTKQFNSTLQNMLSMYVTEHQCDWDTYIPYVLAAYWCSVNKATLKTPFYLMYG